MNNKMIVELQRPGYSQEMKNEKSGTWVSYIIHIQNIGSKISSVLLEHFS